MARKNPISNVRHVFLGISLALFFTRAGYTQDNPGLPQVELPRQPFVINTHKINEVRVVPVVRGLSHPWSLAFLPDGDMLITERTGTLRMVRDGVLLPEPIDGLPDDIMAIRFFGLMEVALHPQFESNHLIYLTYTRALSEDVGTVALVRGRLDGTTLRDVEDLLVVDPWNRKAPRDHPRADGEFTASARLTFAPDGKLLMTMGGAFGLERDDGTVTFFGKAPLAQDLDSHVGKLLRLNDDGSVPDDNPFVGLAGHKPEIYSYGHRNPQGLAVHPETGVVYATEHGPQNGDELNVIQAGENYGWPLFSFGRHYDGQRVSERFSAGGMQEPAVLWVPSIATSGLAVYTGDRFAEWQGDLFVGAMQEGQIPGTGHLQRIELNEHGEEVARESFLRELRQRIRDVRQGPDGLLYLLTEDPNGVLLRLEPVSTDRQ
ncbi:MAG: PQQ-dependent sugar dehydrogenase [Gammaproteobacteria bacterium]